MEDSSSAWNLTTGKERPVVVAVIDSGIDLTHPDLHINNIWKNEKEVAGNRRDDDNNGYIDDLIGWNFVQNNNNPFDLVGHGTHVAGLIAARWNNGRGIAGINRGALIMPLKVLNELGQGWGSDIARAVAYAVDNGARIINISAEHKGQTKFLERALAYAEKKGVLVVVSAGNEAADTRGVEPSNQPGALVVAATLPNDKRAGFSNFGERVHLAAPGFDVLSLRASGSDLVTRVATDPSKIKPGEAIVGKDQQYYRASGTSFAAPLVTGVASLMLAKNPNLTAEQVKRMLMMSADDVEGPGWDQLTGYGIVNARKALEADPNYYLYAELHRVAPARDGNRTVIQVFGTAMGSDWGDFRIELGQGDNPTAWRPAGQLTRGQVKENLLATLTPQDFGATGRWSIRLVAQDRKGLTRESRSSLNLQ
jgi:subtilisin family serine protease